MKDGIVPNTNIETGKAGEIYINHLRWTLPLRVTQHGVVNS